LQADVRFAQARIFDTPGLGHAWEKRWGYGPLAVGRILHHGPDVVMNA
jgi:hypothetical protein